MHPIEQLRYVARASGADATILTEEAARALSVFRDDPNALLAGAKSLLSRQPSVGPLWWMCSHLLSHGEPLAAVRWVLQQLEDDRTPDDLAQAFPDGSTVLISGSPETIVRALLRRSDLQVLVMDVEGQGHGLVRRFDRADIDAEAIDPTHTAGAMAAADVLVIEAGAVGERAALTDLGGLTLAAVARVCATPAWLVAGPGRSLPEPYWQEIVQRIDQPHLPPFVSPHEIVSTELFSRRFGPLVDCPILPELLRPVR